MDIIEIAKIFQDNIEDILRPNIYKHIIKQDNSLCRFDIVNRILIEIQCEDAYDIRTADEWLLDNRKVKINSKGINVLIPLYSYKYVDSDTGEEVDTNDFTSDEIITAIKYNIIHKETVIDTYYSQKMYDIRDTISIDNSKYTIPKPELKTSSLINLFQNITGCKVKYEDVTYYSKKNNELSLSKQKYSELASFLIDEIAKNYTKTLINEYDLSEYELDLIEYSLKYSLDTLFRNKRTYDFDMLKYINKDKIILILSIIDSIIVDITEKVKYKEGYINKDAIKSLETLKKAEAILNIMEANKINRLMNGM